MTKSIEVNQGWYIARPTRNGSVGDWCFVFVKGEPPFLSVWPGIVGASHPEWYHNERQLSRGIAIDDSTVWEFVQRIEIPPEAT